MERTGDWIRLHIEELLGLCCLQNSDQVKGDDVGGACSTYVRENVQIEGVRREGKTVEKRQLRRSWRRWWGGGSVKMDVKGKL